ncbi:MAG TPA: SAM-dependent methyltransferase [Pirellulales bacterium]
MPVSNRFLLTTCQIGAENALKAELLRRDPPLRVSYSRPGFLTFKLPADADWAEDFDPRAVFARSHALSLGKVVGEDLATLPADVWKLVEGQSFDRLHVWPRDRFAPGEHSYTPELSAESQAAEAALAAAAPTGALAHPPDPRPAKRGQRVLDCVLVGPREWWIGVHRVASFAGRFPGGLLPLVLPEKAVSRAYLKMEEGLRWSRLPIKYGESVAELGCSPGGACQALLRRGLHVLGVDPALVEPVVAEHPRFVQIRKRGSEVRKREFRGVQWLTSDMNVAPAFTLDTVEAIVTHPSVQIRGLLLTLKLPDWKLAEQVPEYLERVRGWGYPQVHARQLQHNRQEICVAALRPARRLRKRKPAG